MSFQYGINRPLDLQDSNFLMAGMDVKDDKITSTIRHREPAVYFCKHCGARHSSHHDKQWIQLYDLPICNRKVVWKIERMRILCHCQMGYRVEFLGFKTQSSCSRKGLKSSPCSSNLRAPGKTATAIHLTGK